MKTQISEESARKLRAVNAFLGYNVKIHVHTVKYFSSNFSFEHNVLQIL